MIVFGPVPSRRLGRSLGVNNIPPKICSYSCIYCQLGRTLKMQIDREEFYKPVEIYRGVEEKIKDLENRIENIDYITFVPDGEPTLDINLGGEINLLKSIGVRIAVITNSSLIWREDVQRDLLETDLVSLKIDTVDGEIWRKINRPHPNLDIEDILDGIYRFNRRFKGIVYTETMLIDGVNDNDDILRGTADFISKLSIDKSYISIPIRPPAEIEVDIPREENLNKAYNIFRERDIQVEYLIGYEGNEFTSTGDIKDDILSITSVHPIREDGMRELIRKRDGKWDVIEKLIEEGEIKEVVYRDKKFYIRNLQKRW
ncbi:MAG: radical SAM protein [Thermoplasmata archaeon]|nr:MAG: radical SAM protein [Thermoplasmata archaeon]